MRKKDGKTYHRGHGGHRGRAGVPTSNDDRDRESVLFGYSCSLRRETEGREDREEEFSSCDLSSLRVLRALLFNPYRSRKLHHCKEAGPTVTKTLFEQEGTEGSEKTSRASCSIDDRDRDPLLFVHPCSLRRGTEDREHLSVVPQQIILLSFRPSSVSSVSSVVNSFFRPCRSSRSI